MSTCLFTHSFANATARTNFGVKWNKDGKVTIVSVKGIFILDVVPDCHSTPVNNFNVIVHFIPDPCQSSQVQPVNPFLKGGIDPYTMCKNAKLKTEAFEIALNRSLTPRRMCDDVTSCSSPFWLVDWSPSFYGPSGERCALGTLSVAYHARIFGILQPGKHWDVIADLSEVLHKHYEESGWEGVEGATSGTNIGMEKARVHRQSFIYMKWHPTVHDENGRKFCLLLTLQKDGFIILWKIFDPLSEKADAEILDIFYSGVARPISLEVLTIGEYTSYATVASLTGQIHLLKLQYLQDSKVICDHVGLLWEEEDEIPAHSMVLRSRIDQTSRFILYAAKSSFIVGISFLITDNGIVGLNHGSIAEPLAVSGMIPYQAESVLTLSEVFGCKVISMKDKGLVVQNFPLAADSVNYCCRGIAKTPFSETVFCTLENVRVSYDHLVLREPSKACFYITKNSPYEVFTELCEGEAPLSSKGVLLECFRCLARQNGLTSINFYNEDDNSVDLNHYRVVRWLALADIAQEKNTKGKDPDKIEGFGAIKTKCEHRILREHCLSTLAKLDSITPTNEETLTSLLMCDFLTSVSSFQPEDPSFVQSVYSKFGEQGFRGTSRESCRFDQEGIALQKSTADGCQSGHNFVRCSQSFRLCSERPVRLCPWCKFSYRKDTVFSLPSVCTFCLVPLRFSNE